MDNTETLVTLGTQDKDKEKTEETIKNGQYRDTGNIGYTRYKTKTNKTNKIKHNTQNQMSNIDPIKDCRVNPGIHDG